MSPELDVNLHDVISTFSRKLLVILTIVPQYCSLANNHTLDYQLKGMIDTTSHLDEVRIKWAGVGNNIEQARAPALLEVNGVKIACFRSVFCLPDSNKSFPN